MTRAHPFLWLIILFLLAAPFARAATYYVATTGSDASPGTQTQPFQTIQKGVNTAANGDTVQVAAGTYTEDITWRDKSLTLRGAGAGQSIVTRQSIGTSMSLTYVPAVARLEGFTVQNSGMVNNGSSLTVANCTFSNNYHGIKNTFASNPTVTNCTFTGNYNGGIRNEDSSPTVTQCTFTGNHGSPVYRGGGMSNSSSNPIVTYCTFTGNNDSGMYNTGSSPNVTNCTFAGNNGSGMLSERNSSPAVTNCTFTGNGGGGGGGMYTITGNPTVTNCTFSNNRASGDNVGGGGMYNDTTNATVTNSTFTGNSVSGLNSTGGGMYNTYGSVTVTHCTFRNNTASDGGGIGIYNSAQRIIDCVFIANTGLSTPFNGGQGGGISALSSDSTVTNCTFTENTAPGGGGINTNNGSNGNMIVTNCILWNDTGGEIFNFSNSATVTYSDIQGGYAGTGNINVNPLFLQPASGNYRLQSASPCLNIGSTSAPSLPATDLDGGPRIFGSAPDLGAYEFWTSAYGWFVDKALGNDITGNGSPAFPLATVTKAIAVASAGNSIYIKAGSYGTDKPRITKSLRLFNWLSTGLARIGQP